MSMGKRTSEFNDSAFFPDEFTPMHSPPMDPGSNGTAAYTGTASPALEKAAIAEAPPPKPVEQAPEAPTMEDPAVRAAADEARKPRGRATTYFSGFGLNTQKANVSRRTLLGF